MADQEDDLFGGLSAYVVEDHESAAAKAEERAKRKAGGKWQKDKIREKELERIRKEQAEYKKIPAIPDKRVDPQLESSVPPMRHLAAVLRGPQLALSANIISVKLVESGIGFPLDVYGTIAVRDELDCKRINLFQA